MMRHVHGTNVWRVGEPLPEPAEFDGLVTDQVGPVLTTFAADCVPLLFADPVARVCGSAHAGWRGTVAGVAPRVVARMGELGARPADVRVALGPSIGPCCFEVQADVAAEFARVCAGSVQQRGGRTYVDLWQTNRELLLKAGLAPEHIDAAPPCTHCDPRRFYSYRRDGAGIGQHLAFILGGS